MPTGVHAIEVPSLGDVSILIVNWNSGPYVARCAKAALATGAEVIVVDNASQDGSVEPIAARLPGVRLLRQRSNLGFAGGVNAAARVARGNWLLLLNPDAVPTAEAIAQLRQTLQSMPEAGAVGGCLVDDTGQPQAGFAVRRFPTVLTWAFDLLLVDNIWPTNPVRQRYRAADVPLEGPAPIDVDQPAGACLMLPRSAMARMGGLDEAFYPAWFEDVDLCRRLRDAGLRILYEPRARVSHAGGSSVSSLGRVRFERAWYRNMRRYARKHHGAVVNLTLTALICAGMTMRLCVSIVTGDRAARRAWFAVLGDLIWRRNADGQ